MKSTITLFFILSFTAAISQTGRNSFVIGGDATLSYQNYSPTYNADIAHIKTITFSKNKSVGYFVINNLCLGLSVPLSSSSIKYEYKTSTDYNSTSKSSSYGVGPFIRYYIPVGKLFVLTEGTYSLNKTTYNDSFFDPNSNSSATEKYNVKSNSYRLAAGMAYFLNKHTSLEILANYQNAKYKSDGGTSFNILYNDNRTSNLFISVGFKMYLSPKK